MFKSFQEWFAQSKFNNCTAREKELMLTAWDTCVNNYPEVEGIMATQAGELCIWSYHEGMQAVKRMIDIGIVAVSEEKMQEVFKMKLELQFKSMKGAKNVQSTKQL